MTFLINFDHFWCFNWHFNWILINNWSNLIKNRSRLIDKRSIWYITISMSDRFCHSNSDCLKSESSMIQFVSSYCLSLHIGPSGINFRPNVKPIETNLKTGNWQSKRSKATTSTWFDYIRPMLSNNLDWKSRIEINISSDVYQILT